MTRADKIKLLLIVAAIATPVLGFLIYVILTLVV